MWDDTKGGAATAVAAPDEPLGVIGVGMTAFTRGTSRSPIESLVVAADRALSDASIEPADLDSIHVGTMAPEAFAGRTGLANAVAGQFGVTDCSAHRVENTSASGASAILDAVDAIRAGRADVALVVGGELMSPADTATATDIVSGVVHDAEYAQGVTLPGFGGLAADRYLRVHDADRRALARVAVKNHANAARNPYAQFQTPITVEDVLDSPPVADPLRLYDCCPISDGAAAAVLASEADGVQVAACANAVGTHAVADRDDPLEIRSVREAGATAYEAAGFGPDAVDVACIHDAFTILEWLEMEELGLADTGEAWRLTADGTTDIDGDLPINPGGGLKARGHPLGATGVAQLVELVWQLRGDPPAESEDANGRTVDGADRGLAVNVAGFGNNSVCTLLEGAP